MRNDLLLVVSRLSHGERPLNSVLGRPFKMAKISIKKIFKKSVYEHYEKQLTEKTFFD
jgi:hypothetical protein